MYARVLPTLALVTILCAYSFSVAAPPEPAAAAKGTTAAVPARRLPGQQSRGEVLLPTQWSLLPAGVQIAMGDFPVNFALHPKGPWGAVLHAGFGEHEVAIVDLKGNNVVSRVVLPQCFYGLCFDRDGQRLYVSGGEFSLVHQFRFADGFLSDHQEIRLAEAEKKFIPAGLNCSPDGQTLWVANAWGDMLTRIPLNEPATLEQFSVGNDSYPYLPLSSPDGKRVFVSLWNQAAVAVFDTTAKKIVATWPAASHPTEMVMSPDATTLYVACANGNTVAVLDADSGKTLEKVKSALYPQAPHGSTPNSLALSPDGKTLFVANADNNNVAVFDVGEPRQEPLAGLHPRGLVSDFGAAIAPPRSGSPVANGKGLTPKANPLGPNPMVPAGNPGSVPSTSAALAGSP